MTKLKYAVNRASAYHFKHIVSAVRNNVNNPLYRSKVITYKNELDNVARHNIVYTNNNNIFIEEIGNMQVSYHYE